MSGSRKSPEGEGCPVLGCEHHNCLLKSCLRILFNIDPIPSWQSYERSERRATRGLSELGLKGDLISAIFLQAAGNRPLRGHECSR